MKKKVLVGLLSVLAASSFLVGCGDENDPNSKPDTGNQQVVITDVLTGVKGYPDAVIDKEMKIVRVTLNEDASTFNVHDIEASVNLDVKLYTEFDPTPIENPIITIENGSSHYMIDFSYNGVVETWYLYIYKKPHYTDHLETRSLEKQYKIGDKKPLGELTVYLNNEISVVDISEATVTGFDTNTEGNKKMTISYKNLTIECSYYVEDPYSASIKYTDVYYIGGDFIASVSYLEDGVSKTKDFTLEDVKGIDFNNPGKQKGTIEFLNRSFELEVEVKPYELVVELRNPQTEYYVTTAPNTLPNGPLVITENGRTLVIPINETTVTGFDLTTPGKKKVTISYDKYKYEYEINVIEHTYEFKLEGLTTEYNELDDFDGKGKLIALREDGSRFEINITSEMISGFDTTKVGKQTITIKYDEFKFSQDVEINIKELDVKLDLSTIKKEYFIGDEFNYTPFINYTINGKEFSNWLEKDMFSSVDLTKEGKQTVTIKFKNHEFSYEITVYKPLKTVNYEGTTDSYYVGDEFDYKGQIIFDFGDEIKKVPLNDVTLTGFDSSKKGFCELHYKYGPYFGSLVIISINEHSYFISVSETTENFFLDSEFDGNGYVTYYKDGKEVEKVPLTKDMLEGFDTSKVSNDLKATVKYKNQTVEMRYNVLEHRTSIVYANLKTITYYVGDEFYPDGTITVSKDDKLIDVPVTMEMVSGFDSSKPGVNKITITYEKATYKVDLEIREIYKIETTLEDEAIITDYYGNDENLIIPDTIYGKKVVGIKGCTTPAKTVLIPSGVREIYHNAFSLSGNLEKVSFKPNSELKKIGFNAFGDSHKLVSIDIPETVEIIDGGLTSKSNVIICTELLVRPAGWNLYFNSENTVAWGYSSDDLIFNENYVLAKNSKEAVILKYKGKAPKEFIIPNEIDGVKITNIANNSFENLDGVEKIELATGIKFIGEKAFSNYKEVKFIILPETIEYIGEMAFYSEKSSALVLAKYKEELDPNIVIGAAAIYNTKGIVKSTNGLDWVLLNDDSSIIIGIDKTLEYVEIPSKIENYTVSGSTGSLLQDNDKLKHIYIDKDVKDFNESCYRDIFVYTNAASKPLGLMDCDLFYKTVIYNYNKEGYGKTADGIYYAIVDGKISISGISSNSGEIEIPETILNKPVINLADRMVISNKNMEIILPASITTDNLGFEKLENGFVYSKAKDKVFGNPQFGTNRIVYGYAGKKGITNDGFRWALVADDKVKICEYLSTRKNIEIPSKIAGKYVDGIVDVAFRSNIVENITFASDSQIPFIKGEFRNLTSIRTISLPASIGAIYAFAFNGCKNLTNVNFSKDSTLTLIEPFAFQGCDKLKELYLPHLICNIGDDAFDSQSDIKIYYDGSEDDFAKVNISNNEFVKKHIYYYSEVALPGVNAWHYDTDNKKPIAW